MQQAYYYETKNIWVFPTSNSVDRGKYNLEENARDFVFRITERSYTRTKDDFSLKLQDSKTITVSPGEATIRGYGLEVDITMTLDEPPSAPGSYDIGMRLTKDSQDHVRGDVAYGNVTYYEGVWVGFFDLDWEHEDYLSLGTVDWDGSKYTNLEERSDKHLRIPADYIRVVVKGPKPPFSIESLQEYVDLMPYRYVSKYGDEIYGPFTMKHDRADESLINKYGMRMETTDTSSEKTSLFVIKPHNNTTAYSLNRFMALESKNVGTNIQNTLYMGSSYYQDNGVLTQIVSPTNILINSSNMINLYGQGNVKMYASTASASLYALMTANKFQIATNGGTVSHELYYENSTSYLKMGNLLTYVNGSTVRLQNLGSPSEIEILNKTYTQSLKALNTIYIGSSESATTNLTVITPTSYKQTGSAASSHYNRIDSYGIFNNIAIGVSNGATNTAPTAASNIYAVLKRSSLTINTPTAGEDAAIYFNGSGSNTVSLTHAYNTKELILTGSFSVTGDINAPTSTVTCGRVYHAVYNDYAEFYEKENPKEIIEPGDVIVYNPTTKKYTKSNQLKSRLVIGVCSDSYGTILGGEQGKTIEENLQNYIPIGLSGRVWVKINGFVETGDLVISDENGYATRANTGYESTGTIIGKVLDDTKVDGKVLIQIMLS